MTTTAQIKRFVKPLLERQSQLVHRGNWLFLKPVRHVARAVLIDRTGSANVFQPTWAATPIVDPTEVFSIGWGERIAPPAGGLWKWNDPSIVNALIEVVENRVLPRLLSLETLESFVAFADDRTRFELDSLHGFLLTAAIVDAARGELETAKALCAKVATGKTQFSGPFHTQSHARVMGRLYPLLQADDRAGVVELLHEWEAYSVKHLGLEDIWERTPFPLEERMAR